MYRTIRYDSYDTHTVSYETPIRNEIFYIRYNTYRSIV